jgi:hypothetical protein
VSLPIRLAFAARVGTSHPGGFCLSLAPFAQDISSISREYRLSTVLSRDSEFFSNCLRDVYVETDLIL